LKDPLVEKPKKDTPVSSLLKKMSLHLPEEFLKKVPQVTLEKESELPIKEVPVIPVLRSKECAKHPFSKGGSHMFVDGKCSFCGILY